MLSVDELPQPHGSRQPSLVRQLREHLALLVREKHRKFRLSWIALRNHASTLTANRRQVKSREPTDRHGTFSRLLVPVFPTKEGLEEFVDGAVKNLSASDLDVIAAANGGFGVQSGTRCQMLDFGFAKSQVRLLDGDHTGRSGWVPTEFSHP